MTDLGRLTLLLTCILLLAANSPLPAERALDQELTRLEHAGPSASARARLRELLSYQEQSRRPHPERSQLSLPYFDIAARAQRLLALWDEQAYLQALQQQPALRSKRATSQAQQRAIQRWVKQAPVNELVQFRQTIDFSTQPEEIQRNLCIRLQRLQDWLALAGSAEQAASVLALQRWVAGQDEDNLWQVVAALQGNPSLKGAAPSVVSHWRKTSPTRELRPPEPGHRLDRDWLELALSQPPANLKQQLQHALQSPDSAPLAAWGLWQLADDEAISILKLYSEDPAAIPHLAAEIRTWLP